MYRQSYNAKLCPLLRLFSPNKDCAAENKVNTHTDCHSDNAHIKPKPEQSREEKPCGNYKKNRYNHGNSTMINVSTAENTAEIISSCPEEREASFSFLLPIYWLMITAPPDANAVKKENQNRVE